MANFIKKIKYNLTENSLQSLIWLIDLMPSFFGYSYLKSKVGVSFLIFVVVSSIYIVFMGSVVYQIRFKNGYLDTVKSYMNILIFTVICNSCRWVWSQGKGLRKVLELLKKNDDMPMQFERSTEKRKNIFKYLKYIVLICYTLHFINEIVIYTPKRLAKTDDFSVVSCLGLEPITKSPNKEICTIFLVAQIFPAVIVTVCYDATFLFLFGYTAAMFGILKEELMALDVRNEDAELQEVTGTVGDRLKNIVIRHILTLHTVENIQDIYNFSIGFSFGADAITMCLFFIVPLNVSLNFIPLLAHNFLTFFLYCYQGQKITTAAERFEMAVYCCGWENFDVKEQKIILTMLRQSQRPVIINAATFVPICIYTFACTMQGIYKFGAAFKS
nr:odorant receptor 17 [Papilio dardanus]